MCSAEGTIDCINLVFIAYNTFRDHHAGSKLYTELQVEWKSVNKLYFYGAFQRGAKFLTGDKGVIKKMPIG